MRVIATKKAFYGGNQIAPGDQLDLPVEALKPNQTGGYVLPSWAKLAEPLTAEIYARAAYGVLQEAVTFDDAVGAIVSYFKVDAGTVEAEINAQLDTIKAERAAKAAAEAKAVADAKAAAEAAEAAKRNQGQA